MARRLSEKDKNDIIDSFTEGKTIGKLADEFGCTKLTIIRNLKKNIGERKYKELLIHSKKYDQSIEIQNTHNIGNNSSEQISTINPFLEIIPLNCDIENTSQKDLSSVQISEVVFPKLVFMVVDKKIA